MKKTCMGLALSLLFACGKIDKQEVKYEQVGGNGNSAPNATSSGGAEALLVATLEEAPECAAASEGRLVYVRDRNLLAACVSGKWSYVVPKSGDRLVRTISCMMQVAQESLTASGLDKAPASGLNFFYTINEFANNMRYVQARIADGQQSYTSSTFWHPLQNASGKAPSQQIVLDLAAEANFGIWEFRVDSEMTGDVENSVAVIYSDDDLEGDRLLPFVQEKDCQVYDFEATN